LNVLRHIDTAFTARHTVSAASSKTGIAGTLQYHVLFICCENGSRYQSVKELCEFLRAGNEIQTLNPSSVVDVGKVDFTKLLKEIIS